MTRRGAFLIVIALLYIAPPSRAAGRWMLGVHGGWSFPTGDYASTDSIRAPGATSGPQVGLEVGYRVAGRIVVGVDGDWVGHGRAFEGSASYVDSGLTRVNVKDQYRLPRVGVFAKLLASAQSRAICPYGIVGFGGYRLARKYETQWQDSAGFPVDASTQEYGPGWCFGGRLGIGTLWQAWETVAIDVRGDFHFIDMNEFGVSWGQYLGLHSGAVYSFGSP